MGCALRVAVAVAAAMDMAVAVIVDVDVTVFSDLAVDVVMLVECGDQAHVLTVTSWGHCIDIWKAHHHECASGGDDRACGPASSGA